jgi:hypothetical protein
MKHQLTYEQALTHLADGEIIHAFMSPAPNVLIGADWERDQVLAQLQTSAELAGEQALNMNHGIASLDPITKDYIFFASKPSLRDYAQSLPTTPIPI